MKYNQCTVMEADEAASLIKCLQQFSIEMNNKLQRKLKAGRAGWDDENWTLEDIKKALISHVEKGDFVDVANFAMFAWNRDDFPHTKLHAEKKTCAENALQRNLKDAK